MIIRKGRELLLAACAVLGAGAVFTWMFQGEDIVSAGSTQSGLAYLKKLEQTETAPIEETIRQIKKQEQTKARKEAIRKALESGEISVWELFEDSVILGDSRAMGFSHWEFLDNERVLAYSGAVLKNLEKNGYPEKLKNLNPENVFLSYGLNDISSAIWRDEKSCIADLEKNIAKIKEALPESRIYINSILPVQEKALKRCQGWGKVSALNEAIRAFCGENGYGYIDNTAILGNDGEYFAGDGIHMKWTFYEPWAKNMIAGVYEDEG